MVNRIDKMGRIASLICILAGIAVSGCARAPVGSIDYRVQHTIAAQEKIFSLVVPVSELMQQNTASQVLGIGHFAREYLRRGRGPFLVSQAQGGVAATGSRSRIADLLAKSGVPKHLVFYQTRPRTAQGRDTAELSYKGYVIKLPSCGDWSGHAGFDPSNRSHTDFGCSFQRNTGLMLSDPGDLSVAGDSVERDTPSSDRIIKTYRAGKSLGTPKPALEQKDFADVD